MFICAFAVPRVALHGLYPFTRTVEVAGGVQLRHVARALREYLHWRHPGRILRMTELREVALDDRLSKVTIRPYSFVGLSIEETQHLVDIAEKGPRSMAMSGVRFILPVS